MNCRIGGLRVIGAFIDEFTGAILQLFIFSFVPFVWWFVAARKKEEFFSWIGLKRIVHNKRVIHTLIGVILTAGVYCILTYLCVYLISDQITVAGSQFEGMGLTGLPMALVYGYIRTGLAEEIVFRGFILKRIQGRFGFMAGNLVQAILFGLLHGVPFGLATQSIFVAVCMTILPGAFGWYQGWLNEKRCGGSIVSSWLLHGTMNFIVTCFSL
ncbi:MAG TPA: CPBP family intramembrane metalloprotease [Clostridiales bacterium]|nr:CPBP family intramembrane metalloprotease [Clostridiales bacterium]